jgi:tetratricopeptide (TPR) repeat protein
VATIAGATALLLGAAPIRHSHQMAQEGLILLRLGAYEPASQAFKAALRWNPSHPLARCGARAAAIGRHLDSINSPGSQHAQSVAALPNFGPCGAQRLLFEGDQAFQRWMANPDEKNRQDWGEAVRAYSQAIALDGQLAEAVERLGAMADAQDDLDAARRHYERALDLAKPRPSLDSRYRNGLAKVLLQGNQADRSRAYAFLNGARGNPASDVVMAMELWRQDHGKSDLAFALERLPAQPPEELLKESLGNPWGFKLESGQLLLVGRPLDQRCLLSHARAVTLHLKGQQSAAVLERNRYEPSCQPSNASINTLLCDRLSQAARQGAAVGPTREWLGCDSPAPVASTRTPPLEKEGR